MGVTLFSTSNPLLNDLVFLDAITVPPVDGEDFESHAMKVLTLLESTLSEAGLTKHHIVNVRTTLGDLGADIVKFNELWDRWTSSSLLALPSMSACQLVDDAVPTPGLALSVTATKAPKATLKDRLTRSGGGEPAFMVPSSDSAYPAQPMHFPWSNVIEAGSVV